MRKWLQILAAALIMSVPAGFVLADLNVTEGSGKVLFGFTCFTTKECRASVLTNSAGTEIGTVANPAIVSGIGVANPTAFGSQTGSPIMGFAETTPTALSTNNLGFVSLVPTTRAMRTATTDPYPSGAVPYTATATGTTGATTATLAGAASVTTYICGFSIRANATAAVTGNATVTGTITATLNFTQWTAPAASGLGITEMIFAPCVPASAANTSIAVVSAAPGTGGVVSVTAWGFKL